MDPIADYLTRLRNAAKAQHRIVEVPSSNMKKALTQLLHEQGYIQAYKFDAESTAQGSIKIALKYHPVSKRCAFEKLERVSRPGLRHYSGVKELPRVLNGLGIAVVSTPKGLMTDKKARELNVGGEVICYVY